MYLPKQNYQHQETVYKNTRDKLYYGYFSEQGTGKSKMAVDCFGHLFTNKKINFVLLFSINGVHRAWKEIEIPKFLNIDKKDYRVFLWPNGYKSKSRQQQMKF